MLGPVDSCALGCVWCLGPTAGEQRSNKEDWDELLR
jgi:hypothetical protein